MYRVVGFLPEVKPRGIRLDFSVNTLTNQVESFAEDLRDRFLGGSTRADDGPHQIDVAAGTDGESGADDGTEPGDR